MNSYFRLGLRLDLLLHGLADQISRNSRLLAFFFVLYLVNILQFNFELAIETKLLVDFTRRHELQTLTASSLLLLALPYLFK